MANVTITRTVNAPVDHLWSSWDDFGNIDLYNPNLSKSFLINASARSGLGAERQCDLNDGKNYIQERIIEYIPQRRMKIDIYNGTLPLTSAIAQVDVRALGPNRSELTFSMTFIPKGGFFGLMLVPLMKPQFRKLLGKLADANKTYVETGETVQRAA